MVPATELSAGGAAPARPDTPERLLRRLEWQVLRRLDGRLQGDYRTLLRGEGVDLRDLREYEPGDDLRHLDWNVTARTDVPHIRTYAEDRELTAWLVLDRSSSMGFGRAARPKRRAATDLLTTLALVLARGGNRVGAVLFGDGVEVTIPPRHGRAQVLAIARALLADPPPSHVPTDLGPVLRAVAGMARHRSLVFVVSDFVTRPGWERSLTLLARRHEVVAVQVVDAAEGDLPDAGLVAIEDAETGQQVLVDTGDPVFRKRLRELTIARQQRLVETVARVGIPLHVVSTDEDLVAALVRMAHLRGRWHR